MNSVSVYSKSSVKQNTIQETSHRMIYVTLKTKKFVKIQNLYITL